MFSVSDEGNADPKGQIVVKTGFRPRQFDLIKLNGRDREPGIYEINHNVLKAAIPGYDEDALARPSNFTEENTWVFLRKR